MTESIGHIVSSDEVSSLLPSLLEDSASVRFVSAYVTERAVKWFLKHVKHCDLALVGRFSPQDFMSGASDFAAIRYAIERGYVVRMLSGLHAKIYEIDKSVIFTGSANLTSRGFSLCSTPNVESVVKLPYTNESAAYVSKIVESSVEVTLDKLKAMERLIDDIDIDSTEALAEWPEELYPVDDQLLMSDLPLAAPGTTCKDYQIQEKLDFARIESFLSKGERGAAKSCLKRTKVMRWLIAELQAAPGGLSFGKISSLLHTAIDGDPSPYRSEVKKIQGYLYDYIRLLLDKEIAIDVPGQKSEVMRLKSFDSQHDSFVF